MIREAVNRKTQRGAPVSEVTSFQAPVGGWNARDSIAAMKPSDALKMEDWFPLTTDVMLRKGYVDHVTGITGQVETLVPYSGSGGTNKMFAANSTAIYDVTTAGAVGAAVVSSLTNGRWQTTAMSTGGTDYILMVNGADLMQAYNGSAWSVPSVTGVGSDDWIDLCVWKRRLIAAEQSSMSLWYLAVNAISGAASEIDLGPLFKKGGYIQAVKNWSIDAGEGLDDYLVIATSQGEIAIYKGTDPSSSVSFGLVGVLTVGEPLGRRCLVKFGGDLVLLCHDGFVLLGSIIITERNKPQTAISDKILNAVYDAAADYATNFGWEGLVYPAGAFLLINVPVQTGSQQQQYVMNSITGSWCKFTGWAANTFCIFGEQLYYGGNGVVCKAWFGLQDNGAAITGSVKQAFNYYGSRGQLKQFKMMRPVFMSSGTPTYLMNMNVDYKDQIPTGTLSAPAVTASTWKPTGNAVWGTAQWGGALSARAYWASASGVGVCGAPYLKVQANNIEVHWAATDVVYERGGVM